MFSLPNRKAFSGADCILPELQMVGCSRMSYARVPGLEAHSHDNAFEIFWLESGEVEWWTGEQAYRFSAGHVYINRPDEPHGSVGQAIQPCAYYWFQLVPDENSHLPGLSAAEAETILGALHRVEPRCFPVSAEVGLYFRSMFQELEARGALSHAILRAQLHLLLATLVRDANAGSAPRLSPPIRRVVNHIENNLGEDFDNERLARMCGLSGGHFRERFRTETGFTPHAFILRRRVEAAKQLLLEDGLSVTEISRNLGFCSSQHFATVFKRIEGVAPSQFTRE